VAYENDIWVLQSKSFPEPWGKLIENSVSWEVYKQKQQRIEDQLLTHVQLDGYYYFAWI